MLQLSQERKHAQGLSITKEGKSEKLQQQKQEG